MFFDRFSTLDDIPRRKRHNPEMLLEFLRASGVRRISTFEMDDKIMGALESLHERGAIRLHEADEDQYPWHGFDLPTEKRKETAND